MPRMPFFSMFWDCSYIVGPFESLLFSLPISSCSEIQDVGGDQGNCDESYAE
jgi:hypothetical protein